MRIRIGISEHIGPLWVTESTYVGRRRRKRIYHRARQRTHHVKHRLTSLGWSVTIISILMWGTLGVIWGTLAVALLIGAIIWYVRYTR